MNHPIIANNDAQTRYNEMIQEAANYRLAAKATKQNGLTKLINTFMSLFI